MRIKVDSDARAVSVFWSKAAGGLVDAAAAAIVGSTEEGKRLGRLQIQGALSPRAANTLTTQYFHDEHAGGVNAVTGYLHGRWFRRSAGGQRTDILAEYETGASIRPARGGALAIPLPSGLRLVPGARRTRLSPERFEQLTGLELRLVEKWGKRFLVAAGARIGAKGRIQGFKRGAANKNGSFKQGAATIFAFVLTKGVRLPKRLDFGLLRTKLVDDLAGRLVIEMGKRDQL